jgi:uncharacterized protein YabN with tetrapyrrole methylase and pyrophosphatase domain
MNCKNNETLKPSDDLAEVLHSALNDFLLLLTKVRSVSSKEQFDAFSEIITTICKDPSRERPTVDTVQISNSSELLKPLRDNLSTIEHAQSMLNLACSQGFQWPSRESCWDKVIEEVAELSAEIENGDRERLQEELGDLLLTLISFADFEKLNADMILRKATDKFTKRYQVLESEAASQNKTVFDMTAAERENAWQKAKMQGL